MSTNWRNISYLQGGTKRQQAAYNTLTNHHILDILQAFDPVLVSTVCVDIDIDTSDLDIICHAEDLTVLYKCAQDNFGSCENFELWYRSSGQHELVCAFLLDEFEIEIFGARQPAESQQAYRHLCMMERLLNMGGSQLREEIRALKQSGLKTEPAFAQRLKLTGDPYLALLELEKSSDAHLLQLLNFSDWQA